MASSSQDQKLMLLKAEFGMHGYGVYWTIIELIAAQINKDNITTSLSFSEKIWRKITEFSPKKFQNFAEFCQKIKLFQITFVEDKEKTVIIDCPNVLKYKDEHLRKSVVTPDKDRDKLRSNSVATPEEDKDTERETEREGEKEHVPRSQCPQNFKPTEATFARLRLAACRQPKPDDIEKFICHYRAKGDWLEDWQEKFIAWMIRQKNFETKDGTDPQPPTQDLPEWAQVPKDNQSLDGWAAKYGHSRAKKGEFGFEYRKRLEAEVKSKLQGGNSSNG